MKAVFQISKLQHKTLGASWVWSRLALPLKQTCCKYRNLPKISPPSKYAHPPFLNEVAAKGAFLSKVRPPIYVAVHAALLSKKHRRSSTVQEEGLTNEGRHHSLLLHKQVHNKSHCRFHCMHIYVTRARLTGCEVGVRWVYFREKYHNSRKYAHPLFDSSKRGVV